MRPTDLGPVLKGAVAAAVVVLINVALVAVPVLGAHAFDPRTHASTLDALIVAISIFSLGHGAAVTLSGAGIEGAVTLPPLGLTLVFFLVAMLRVRRLGRSLEVVGADGALRQGALPALVMALAGFAGMYALVCTLLSLLGASDGMRPVVAAVAFGTLALAVTAGVAGLALSLTRRASDALPAVGPLALVPEPYASVIRAAAATLLLMLSGAAVLTVVQLALHRSQIAALTEALDPGWFGGSVLVLGQLAFLPTVIVWVLILMCGGTLALGLGTSVSLEGSVVGVLPQLPLLGAVPEPGAFSPWLQALVLVPLAAVIVGALILARSTREASVRDRVVAWCAYPLTVLLSVLALAALAGGSIGSAQLAHVGPVLLSVILPLLGIVLVPTGLIGGWTQTGLDAWVRRSVHDLRTRVEQAEGAGTERAGADGDAPDTDASDPDAPAMPEGATAPSTEESSTGPASS